MKNNVKMVGLVILGLVGIQFILDHLEARGFDDKTIGYITTFIAVVVFIGFLYYFGKNYLEKDREQKRYYRQLAANVDNMNGSDFEYWCANLLKANGFYDVVVTQGSNDQGVDILAKQDGYRYAIQCKRYGTRLGNKPIQEVASGRSIYHCDRAAVLTNNYFTEGGKQAAEANNVELWDRDTLFAMLAALDDN